MRQLRIRLVFRRRWTGTNPAFPGVVYINKRPEKLLTLPAASFIEAGAPLDAIMCLAGPGQFQIGRLTFQTKTR